MTFKRKRKLETVYGGIMEEVNELRLQLAGKKLFLPLIIKKTHPVLLLLKFKPKMLFFGFLMIMNELIGHLPLFYLQDYGFVRIFITHLLSN